MLPVAGLVVGVLSLFVNLLRADTVTQPARAFGLGSIENAALSPDGTQLATAGTGGVVLREVNTGAVVRSWPLTNVCSLAFSADGKQLLTGFGEYGVAADTLPAKLWDVTTGELRRTLDGAYNAVAFAKDGSKYAACSYIYSNNVSTQARAVVFDAATGQPLVSFNAGNEVIFGAAFSADGTRLMTVGTKVRLWDLASGKLKYAWGETNDYFFSAAISPDGTRVAGGATVQRVFGPDDMYYSYALMLWNATNGQFVRAFEDPNSNYDEIGGGAVRALTFSPDGSQMVFGTGEWWDYDAGDLHFVEVATGAPVKTIRRAHGGDINFIGYTPDGRQLVTAAYPSAWSLTADSCFRRWDLATGVAQLTGGGYFRYLGALALSADGSTVVTTSKGQANACSWDAASGQLLATFVPEGFVTTVSLTGDGRQALLGRDFQPSCLVDTARGTVLREFGDLQGNAYHLVSAITDDGRRAVFLNWLINGIMETATGSTLVNFSLTTDAIATDISPDGALVVVANSDYAARLFDGLTGNVLQIFSGHTSNLTSVALSADGTKVVTGCADGTARLYDVASGRMLFEFAAHVGAVNSVAISSNGLRIVTGGYDHTAKIWDGQSGKLRRTLAGHAREVVSVGISDDGTKALTCGSYAQAYLWDISDLAGNLMISQAVGKVRLQWAQGTLQARSGMDGAWQEVPGAASPYTVPAGPSAQFFRLK